MKRSLNCILLCGSPGVGKTSVTELLKKEGYKSVTIGTLMKDIAVAEKYVKNRDQIRYLPKKVTSALRKSAIRQISAMSGTVLIDTHVSVCSGNRYTSGIPYDAISMLKGLSGIIMIDATEKEILARRKGDKSRTREIEDKVKIENQRMINLSALSYYSTYLNLPLYIIHNRQGRIQETANRCIEAIKNMD